MLQFSRLCTGKMVMRMKFGVRFAFFLYLIVAVTVLMPVLVSMIMLILMNLGERCLDH